MKLTMGNNFSNKLSKCKHVQSSKFWVPIKTLSIKRNGYGDAIKTMVVKCNQCGEEKEQKEVFTDTRVDFGYRPYIHSKGAIYKNASRKDYKQDAKEHFKIFN
jgi:hypothetical protein